MKPSIKYVVVEILSDSRDILVEKNLKLEACDTYERAEKQIEDLQGNGMLRNYGIKKCYMIYSR